jgi:hypothetical protein
MVIDDIPLNKFKERRLPDPKALLTGNQSFYVSVFIRKKK